VGRKKRIRSRSTEERLGLYELMERVYGEPKRELVVRPAKQPAKPGRKRRAQISRETREATGWAILEDLKRRGVRGIRTKVGTQKRKRQGQVVGKLRARHVRDCKRALKDLEARKRTTAAAVVANRKRTKKGR